MNFRRIHIETASTVILEPCRSLDRAFSALAYYGDECISAEICGDGGSVFLLRDDAGFWFACA